MKELIVKGFTSIRKEPKNIDKKGIPIYQHEYKKEFDDVYIYRFKNVFIRYPLFFSEKKYLKIFTDIIFPKIKLYKVFAASAYFFLKKPTLSVKTFKGNYIWATDTMTYGYYHWFCDVLVKLLYAKKLNFIDSTYTLLLEEKFKNLDYVKESLDFLGLKYEYYRKSDNIKIENLIFLPNLAPSGDFYDSAMIDLRDSFQNLFQANENEFNDKVYISRKKAARRKLVNEDEVVEILKEYGFSIYYFEELSLEEKIKMLVNSKYLVSIHGAGLTNMIFMNKGAKILEFRPYNDYLLNAYFSLTSALGHDYYYCLGTSSNNDFHRGDLTLDIEEFKLALNSMFDK